MEQFVRYPGPRGFLDFSSREIAMREPRSGEKEKPLVTLDLNLTFMQTPTVKRVKLMATQQARAYQPLFF